MILKALEMQGFKSFPDKTKLVFNEGITAVVGPNGSGKSNISDAVRWVLGEQSSKSLRGSKMEDVIFSGTSVRRAQGFAEVTLFLDNSDRESGFDADELNVTRRFYRSGESEYLLNGKAVRLRDVHEAFMDTGLGRDGYSIVSQGKIADMISSKGNERREMFEEAAGISHYRYSRTDALRKLALAEDNLVRLRDILTQLEERVEPLRVQSEKAKQFLVLAEEKKTLEIGLWLHTIDKTREELRKHEDALSLASAQYEKTEENLAEIAAGAEKAIEQAQAITDEIERFGAESSSLDEQAAAADGQAAVLEGSVEHNRETIARIENDKLVTGRDSDELQKEIEMNLKLINQLERLIIEKKKQMQEITAKLESAAGQSGSLADEAAQAAAQVAALTKQLADARVESSTALSSIEEIKTRISTVDELITARTVNLRKAHEVLHEAERAVEQSDEKIKELSCSLDGCVLKYNAKDKKADKIKRELDDLSFERQKTDSRMKMLEDLEKHMEGYSGSVKAVITQAGAGRLKGIRGAVSQLIEVSDEYAAAIETALGNSVQSIITETENDAKHAIYHLQKNSLGRATFLPITSVKGRSLDEQGLEDNDGYIGIASSLVRCDEEYRQIIEGLLGKTAVAEDIDSAIAMAKKYEYRFKTVTLDGQVVNAGGSITGGSRVQNAGILTRASEIDSLKKKVGELSKLVDEKQKEYDQCLTQLNKLRADVDGLKADVLNAQEEKIRREGRVSLCAEQATAANEALNELNTEKSTADGRIAMLKIALDNAEAAVETITQEISGHEELLSGLGEKREELERAKEEITESVTALNLEIHDAQKDSASKRETVNQLRFRLLNQDDRVNQLNEEIVQLNAKNKELEQNAAQLRRQARQFRELSSSKREDVERLIQKRDESQTLSSELRAKERLETAEREKLSGELARLEERKDAKQKEYEETVSKLYDEYQLTRREAVELDIQIEDVKQAGRRLGEIKNSIRGLGSVNVGAIEEYQQVSERYTFMKSQISDVELSKQELLKLTEELTDKMSKQFREEFAKINTSFSETFSELFGGGKAELLLEDEHDVLECNIEIKVQPPGKNVKNIDLLSGGEKGLSAIALLFAILKVNPAPFCIFDEVEAALDEVNVTRYAQYVRRMTKNTQFIVITHRRGTMEEADVLYGITMQEEGVSKLLELKTAEMAKRLGIS